MNDFITECAKNLRKRNCRRCPFSINNNGHNQYCGVLTSDSCENLQRGYVDGKYAFHEGKLVEVVEDGKVAYSKKEIREWFDNGEDISNIILDSSLTDLSWLFQYREDFNQDISNWDVSNVIDMECMFYNAKSFNQDISKWDTSNVVYMQGMFYKAESFNQDLSNWDVSNVMDMELMFYNATSFNQDLSKWDTSNVIHMRGMFDNSGYTFPEPKY
jgi:surface protein